MLFNNQKVAKNNPSYLKSLPKLPLNFSDTFESIFVDTDDLKLHAVVGGTGPVLLLLGGWPQTWYTWRFIMPELAKQYTVIAVDPRGVNLSDIPSEGYDSATLATDMVKLMSILGYEKFNMVGYDIGMWTGYAIAVDYPGKIERLAVAEAIIPGVSPSVPLFSNNFFNGLAWHFAFNWAGDINERMVEGREEIYFGHQFISKAATPKTIPSYAIDYYVDVLKSTPGAVKASFEYYRCIDMLISQNSERIKTKLTIPILAIGGEKSCGISVADEMKRVAVDVTTLVIPDCGHFVPEEAPQLLLIALKSFFEPYRIAYLSE